MVRLSRCRRSAVGRGAAGGRARAARGRRAGARLRLDRERGAAPVADAACRLSATGRGRRDRLSQSPGRDGAWRTPGRAPRASRCRRALRRVVWRAPIAANGSAGGKFCRPWRRGGSMRPAGPLDAHAGADRPRAGQAADSVTTRVDVRPLETPRPLSMDSRAVAAEPAVTPRAMPESRGNPSGVDRAAQPTSGTSRRTGIRKLQRAGACGGTLRQPAAVAPAAPLRDAIIAGRPQQRGQRPSCHPRHHRPDRRTRAGASPPAAAAQTSAQRSLRVPSPTICAAAPAGATMSSPLAIGAVSAVLRNLLDNGLVEAGAAMGSTVDRERGRARHDRPRESPRSRRGSTCSCIR